MKSFTDIEKQKILKFIEDNPGCDKQIIANELQFKNKVQLWNIIKELREEKSVGVRPFGNKNKLTYYNLTLKKVNPFNPGNQTDSNNMASSVISQQESKIENDSLKLLKFIKANPQCDKKFVFEHLGFNNEKTRVLAIKLRDEDKIKIETIGKSRNQLYRIVPPIKNDKEITLNRSTKNFDKYIFNGLELSKGATVLAIVNQYVKDNHNVTFEELKRIFKDEMLGNKKYGVFQSLIIAELNPKRFFIKQPLELKDQSMIAVCNQVSAMNIIPVIILAKKLGYIITKSDG